MFYVCARLNDQDLWLCDQLKIIQNANYVLLIFHKNYCMVFCNSLIRQNRLPPVLRPMSIGLLIQLPLSRCIDCHPSYSHQIFH